MLWNLLIKDLHRARRNPWPNLLNLALPLCITGLIGLVFGPSSKGGGMGQIKLAVVDEDDSVFSSFLRGAMNQGEAKKYLDLRFLEKESALAQIDDDKVSAVLIIPAGFTQGYLKNSGAVEFELVKNPAQSFYPAIVEEFMRVVVTALNAVSRNLRGDFPQWLEVLEKEGRPDVRTIARLTERLGEKFDRLDGFLFPPLVGYEKETRTKEKDSGVAVNVFGYLLPGLAAMFILFLADNSVRDLYREIRLKTFDRFRTLHHRVLPMISSKVVLSMTVVILGSVILFLCGGWIFRIEWNRPIPMALLILAYGLFASGFMALLAALARSERRADVLNGVIVLFLSFLGGSFFPARQLPPFLRDHVCPMMPNYWFIESLRGLQSGSGDVVWTVSALKLAIVGAVLVLVAATLFQRALAKGARA
ncbi:MAG TPA: ABC transporter permease [Verrucomicrobiae bacterium]|nr:ABC transporter permease [Verrucomicrobiae bacterium]